jgi:putative PIN family toxin of toxin-antitoxin system
VLVVLDTNILLSALITPEGTTAAIYEAWRNRRFVLLTCGEQREEIRRVSRYPKMRTLVEPHLVGSMLNSMQSRARVYLIRERRNHAWDEGDSYLLDLAAEGEADYLVTGDKRAGLLQRGKVGRAAILSVKSFHRDVLRG